MKYIPNVVSSKLGRQALVAAKHSPTLLFGAGVVGVIGSTVLACRATLKLEEVVHQTQNDLDTARDLVHEDYSDTDRKKDITLIYVRSTARIAKLYGPSVCLGAASISALTASHKILNGRNVALTAAYAAIERGFHDYRARVVDRYGEEVDREMRYASEDVGVINDKGRTVTEKRVSPDAATMYARFYDQMSPNWSKDPETNLIFLRAQQNYLNDLLKARGHVFLNEVYSTLGIDHSEAGAVVGWVLGNGDNFIDFGIWDNNEGCRDFVNGREGSILLDFNVDGIIFDKIDQRKGRLAWQS